MRKRGISVLRLFTAIKLFFVIVFCTIYLISFSQFGPLVYQSFFAETDRFASGTMVGTVSVANLSKEEAIQAVQEKVNEWKASARLSIAYQEKTETVPVQFFAFQVEQSVEQAVDGKPSQFVVQIDKEAFSSLVHKLVIPSLASLLNREQLERDMIHIVSRLQLNPQPIDLARYIAGKQAVENMPVSAATMNRLGEHRAEVLAWIANHPAIEIKGKSVFSLLSYIKGLSSDGMSLIASAVYQVMLPTNFTVVERHTSRSLPDGIPLGYEAKVDSKTRDLRFYNPNINSYTLRFQEIGDGFRVTLVGLPFAYKYVLKAGEVEYFNPRTIVQYSPFLKPGERQIKQIGKQGMLAKVKKETYDENNQLIRSEAVSEDFYPPAYTIEVRGLELGANLNNGTNGTTGENTSPSGQTTDNQSEKEQTPKATDGQNESTQYEK